MLQNNLKVTFIDEALANADNGEIFVQLPAGIYSHRGADADCQPILNGFNILLPLLIMIRNWPWTVFNGNHTSRLSLPYRPSGYSRKRKS